MAKVSAQIPDELDEKLNDRTDYPNKLKSDVIREAFEVYVQIENPGELIDESTA